MKKGEKTLLFLANTLNFDDDAVIVALQKEERKEPYQG